ncbi:WD40-repeat-containing domain protein [Suillus fuscotomentosus]|uniref:WD40-repeat-containing domain protein n=1 Tax=Suillus fuscotomentosus TaxID=1912939 RepID=A0AAD4HL38_9AGAM|nr:WD40-repeat-containing domain protein [Suillus fuscotomentosus]KAG1900477.1 WD40-repeat-containing domain protein [Suillus fuscotomentosus]
MPSVEEPRILLTKSTVLTNPALSRHRSEGIWLGVEEVGHLFVQASFKLSRLQPVLSSSSYTSGLHRRSWHTFDNLKVLHSLPALTFVGHGTAPISYPGRIMGLITPLKHKSPSDIYILLKFADTRIASSSRDKTVRLWNVGTGKLLGEPLEGHTGAVFLVSISPDGTRIASGSEDKTVRLWDVGTGQLLGEPLEGHTGAVISVAFSPDGTRIASSSSDNTATVGCGDRAAIG